METLFLNGFSQCQNPKVQNWDVTPREPHLPKKHHQISQDAEG